MTHEVFICHSSNDASIANLACATLESKHIKCWIAPRDVLPGVIWGESVANAIDESRIVVLIISTSSCQSSQVLREVERAASHNIPILPLRIDDVSISGAIGFFVSSRHWLDAQTPPLKKHLQKLADTVKQLLEQEPATRTSPNATLTKTTGYTKEDVEANKIRQLVLVCPRCGNKLRSGAGFCNRCGAPISEVAGNEAENKEKREAIEALEKAEKEAEEARKVQEAKEKAEREAEEARKVQEAKEAAEREAEEARKVQEAKAKAAEREAEEARKVQEAKAKAAEREAEEARKVQEAKAKAAREPEVASPSSQQALSCPACGNILRPGAGFCNKCGTHISQDEKTIDEESTQKESVKDSPYSLYCPKCGYELRPGAGFCDRCGAHIRKTGS